ncbi:kinase-like domain-containing protein [Phyllosticta capitalensis]
MASTFFRSPLEKSTSDVASEGDESPRDSPHPTEVPTLTRVRSTDTQSTENVSRSFPEAQYQPQPVDLKDVTLVALLEDKAINDIVLFLNERRNLRTQRPLTKHDPEVQAMAKEKYLCMFNQLKQYGAIDDNVHRPEYKPIRDKVNRHLEEATRQHNELLRSRQLDGITSSSGNILYPTGSCEEMPHETQVVVRNPAVAHDRSPLFSHPLFNQTEPLEYFSEIGRGGYGRVYKVKNVLDSGFYAIKQIPLSQTRLYRIANRGKDELDALLKEVRTMQMLDHPHIVRYHGAWVEYKTAYENMPKRIGEDSTTETGSGSSEATESQGRIFPISLEDDGIVFGDDSNSNSTQKLGVPDDSPMTTRPRRGSYADSVSDDFIAPNCIYRDAESSGDTLTRKSASDELEDEVEVIPRDDTDNLSSLMSSHKLTQEDEPESKSKPPFEYVLSIQMALYPMNLAEYLSSNTVFLPDGGVQARHCFHVDVSLKILLAIVDGVRYLHARKLVHRDLKPANIFVSAEEDEYENKNNILLGACKGCRAAGVINNSQLGIRIGDFGLVTDIAQLGQQVPPNAPAKVVGTEFYRPPTPAPRANEKLDVFALGVIAFELLWHFSTGMERFQTLSALKKGEIPANFAEKVGDERIGGVIKRMVNDDEDLRPTCKQVQTELEEILSSLD